MNSNEMWLNLLFFLVLFVVVYILTYFLNLHKFKNGKKETIGELQYLVMKFRLDKKKLNVRRMLLWFSLIDAFIISFVATFISMLKVDAIWQMLIGFVLLFGLIYALYEIYGRHLVNSGLKKKGE